MSRLKASAGPALVVVLGVAILVLILAAVAAALMPVEASEIGLGFGALVDALRGQFSAVGGLTGLSLWTDLGLLIASYVFVCLAIWAQDEIRRYFSNRGHFE